MKPAVPKYYGQRSKKSVKNKSTGADAAKTDFNRKIKND